MNRQGIVDSQAHGIPAQDHIRFESGPLSVTLEPGRDGRVAVKTERLGQRTDRWEYRYDVQGRLASALLNGSIMEAYEYGRNGERVADRIRARGMARRDLVYDSSGRLARAGRATYLHDRSGRRAVVAGARGRTHLVHERGHGLRAAYLANGLVKEYENDDMGRPVRVISGGRIVEVFHWLDELRLGAWEDRSGVRLVEFAYGRGRIPRAVRVTTGGRSVGYLLGADQVGTVKAVATHGGRLVQYLQYNSFGNVLERSGLDLRLPLGFAGGVVDRDTGLVRFGYRDYDPDVGRFIAPDPLGDTGGDHDPWEYCVDGPVNMVDPLGLQGEEADDEQEEPSFWNKYGKYFPFVGKAETAKKMDRRYKNTDQKWSEKTKKLMQGSAGDEGAGTDELYRIYTEENKKNMYDSADDTVDELGPNMTKLPRKGMPRK